MNLTKNQALIALGGAGLLIVFGLVIFFNLNSRTEPQKATLSFWGVEEEEFWAPVFEAYKGVNANVVIEYKKVGRNYEREIVDALAAGKGPDVFMIHNRDLGKTEDKLFPLPPEKLGLTAMRDLFPTVVEQDFVSGETIFALPASMDTLALFYNRDLLDQDGIPNPPLTWNEFKDDVLKLVSRGESGQLIWAGAAIGGTEKNIPHATDILQVIMMQNGARMLDERGTSAIFNSPEGVKAFDFYLQFGNPNSAAFTWNAAQENAFESFAQGKTAMAFGYFYDLKTVKDKNPFLPVRVAPLPRVSSRATVNFADYWGLAVAKQSKNPGPAWDFIIFATTNPVGAGAYTSVSGKLPALKSLLQNITKEPERGVFASAALTARSWRMPDKEAVRSLLNAAIQGVLSGQFDSERGLTQASDGVTQLLSRP